MAFIRNIEILRSWFQKAKVAQLKMTKLSLKTISLTI